MNWPAHLSLEAGPVGPVQLALFAAASGDHNPLHLDPEVAQRAGFERPIVHGMLSMALAGRLFTTHFGPGSVRSLHTRFTGVALAGQTLTFTARLERDEGELARYALEGCTAQGTPVLTGHAQVGAAR